MSEANELPPVSPAERAVAWLGILAAAGILFVCVDLAFGGKITGAIGQAVNTAAPVGGCSEC